MKARFILSSRQIPLDRSILFEIRTSNRLAASAKLYPTPRRKSPTWTLWDAFVNERFRGKGLQRRLIRARVSYARRHGGKTIEVWVHPCNSFSLNNLVAEGFRFRHGMRRTFGESKTRFLGLTKSL